MSAAMAQIILTLLLLVGAIVFVILDENPLAVALIGAVAGQGASVGVAKAANGTGS